MCKGKFSALLAAILCGLAAHGEVQTNRLGSLKPSSIVVTGVTDIVTSANVTSTVNAVAGDLATNAANYAVVSHNTNESAHADIRLSISNKVGFTDYAPQVVANRVLITDTNTIILETESGLLQVDIRSTPGELPDVSSTATFKELTDYASWGLPESYAAGLTNGGFADPGSLGVMVCHATNFPAGPWLDSTFAATTVRGYYLVITNDTTINGLYSTSTNHEARIGVLETTDSVGVHNTNDFAHPNLQASISNGTNKAYESFTNTLYDVSRNNTATYLGVLGYTGSVIIVEREWTEGSQYNDMAGTYLYSGANEYVHTGLYNSVYVLFLNPNTEAWEFNKDSQALYSTAEFSGALVDDPYFVASFGEASPIPVVKKAATVQEALNYKYDASNPSNYVDAVSATNIAQSAQGLVGTYYGYGSINSDLAGYYVLSNAFNAVGSFHAITNTAVTNLQYVAQFATANSRITAQPASTVHVKLWAGINTGGARSASINCELYVLTTNGTKIIEFAGTTPVALGALTYCEFDVPINTNLVFNQTVRYSTKVKVTSQANNPNVFIYSEDGRPFMVEIPLSSGQFAFQSDLTALDSRVTALEARPSGGSTIYRPLIASTTNIVVTSTQSIYRVTAAVSQTNNCNMSALNTTNQAASFEVWYDAQTTNALNVVWPANWTFETGVPEMTVTGVYRFVCTTLNGTTASVRQVYPTPCWYQDLPVGDPINANSVSVGLMYQNAWLGATTGTSVYFVASHPMPSRTIKLKMRLRENDEIATNSVQVWIGTGNMALVTKGSYERNLRWYDTPDGWCDNDEVLVIPASTGNLTGGNCRGIRIDLTRTNAVGRLNFNGCEWCPLNELEQAAYAAGWRP